jgi:translocation and assembly module TamA
MRRKYLWVFLWVWLLCLPAWVLAQGTSPAPADSAATPAANRTQAAFTLEIQAPEEIADLLNKHLELQRYRELTDLGTDELARLLTQAEEDTRKMVATLGYFSPTISATQSSAEAGAIPIVHITVTPGEITRVSQVSIQFSGPLATDEASKDQRELIRSSWPLPTGTRFTQTAWDAAKQQALRQLTSLRYAAGQIGRTVADVDPDTHQVQLEITLESGPAYRLGELQVSGLTRHDVALVQHLARLSQSVDYNQAELAAAQQRLSDSGYFDSVFVTLDTTADPKHAPVLVKLREGQLQKIVLGVGASTDTGPRLSAEHTHHRVAGSDWRAVTKAQLERDARALSSELTSPPDEASWRWVAFGEVKQELLGTLEVTSQQLRGGRKQTSQRIDRNIYVQYDRAESVATDTDQPELAQSVSANYAFTVRYYDSFPFPSSGWGWGAELGGGTTLGGTREPYTRIVTRWQGFLGLGNASNTAASSGRLSMRTTLGALIAQDSATLPSTQLFLAGGDNSVRGYNLNEIGITLADGTTTAGRYLATGSVEWQHPLRINGRPSDWESTAFVDAGAVANQPSDLHAKLGVGVGARWKSTVGPLQVDLAYGVDTQRFRLHMNLGFTF